jgi:hypothetical protein
MRKLIVRRLLIAASLIVLPARLLTGLEFTSTFDNIKVQARPGEVVNREFRLRLTTGQASVHFRSRVEDWWQDETGAQSFYRPPGTLARSCGPWISLNPVETAVAAGGTLAVRVTIAVPRDVRPGGYWCVLTVDELPDPLAAGPRGIAITFLSSISVGIFVDLAPVDRRIEISSVELSASQARVRLRNAGQAPAAVSGRIEFVAPGGKAPVATVTLPRVTVLPEPVPTRLMTAALPGPRKLPDGRYLVRVVLDAGLEHLIGVQKEMEIRHEAAGSTR